MLAVCTYCRGNGPIAIYGTREFLWRSGADETDRSLSLLIYHYALSPYKSQQQQAWAGAFLLNSPGPWYQHHCALGQ